MAKANEIKINRNLNVQPINQQTNSTTTGTQNTIPTSTPAQQNGSWGMGEKIDTRSLSQQFVDTVKSDWKEAGKERKEKVRPTLTLQNLSPEVKPVDTFEETAGGWNYGYDRAVSQQDNQQGHYNALNGTGHVVGIPERQGMALNVPENQQGEKMPERTSRLGNLRQPTVESGTVNQPVNNTNVKTQNKTVQPAVSNQNPQQEERIVTPDEFGRREVNPDEFGGLKGAQQQQPEQRPGMDLQETPGGVIYGRASGDGGTRIETQADPYNAEAYYMAGRQTNYNALQKMNSYDIAVSVAGGYDPYGSQAMRDLMQYDPSKYQEVQNYIKQIQGEENINNIATNGTINAKSQTEKATDTVNNSITSWVNQNSNERNSSQVQSILTDKLANSQVANSATQEMLNLNAQMADIQEKMANLPNEAKKAFKGDFPQYIVDAYVSNNTQRLQSELNKLQSRYNGAIDLYKTELSQKQWETEMELKQRQFNSDQNYRNWQMSNADRKLALDTQQQYWNQDYMNRKLRYDNIQEINGSAYVMDANGNWTRLSDDIAYQSYKGSVQEKLQSYMNMFPDGADGGQCERFTDSFTYTTTGLKMEGANGRAYTTAEEKNSYVNTWIPEVGSVAVFDYGIKQNDGVNYGHTMLVTGYDPNTGIITLKGSNKSKKPGEYEKVYTQTMSLSNLNAQGAFQGFWNPYLDKVAESYQDSATNSLFARVNTPMATMIDTLKTSATTAGQLTEIAVGEQMYNTMYELQQGGYLDKLISAGVVEDFINGLDRKKFGKQNDERGSEFLNQLGTFIRNKVKDEEVAYAMNRLYQLVEQKLRKESGAAISSSEWAMDFQLFLPQPGQSDTLRRKQLEAWDDIIYKQLSGAGMKSNQYVPIFDYTYGGNLGSGREIR